MAENSSSISRRRKWLEDDDDEFIWHNFFLPFTKNVVEDQKRKRTRYSRKPNIDRDRHQYALRLESDYWGESPTYDSKMFRRRFRMQRQLFDRILAQLQQQSKLFCQKPDAVGNMGFTGKQKMTCALRFLAYGSSADQLDELIRMAETTVLKTVRMFCDSIIECFSTEYLRRPTESDLDAILKFSNE